MDLQDVNIRLITSSYSAGMSDDTSDTPVRPVSRGHSRQLRRRLRAARLERGLTLQHVADFIAKAEGLKSLTDAAVSQWESFKRHPPVNLMAAWARAVGLRLIVDLDDRSGERVPVLLHPRTADLAREIDSLNDDDRAYIEDTVRRIRR